MSETRKQNTVWLIGIMNNKFDGNQLPLIRQVMSRLFYSIKKEKKTIAEAASIAADEILVSWEKANIPTTQKPNIVAKLKKVYDEYVRLGKNKFRKSNTQVQNIKTFEEKLNTLFDISHANVESMIKIDADRKFLKDQSGERKMYMAGIDKKFAEKAKRKMKRIEQEEKHLKKNHDSGETAKVISDKEVSGSDSESLSSGNNEDVSISKYQEKTISKQLNTPITSTSLKNKDANLKKIKLIKDPTLCSALDRVNVSSRKAMHIITPALKAAGIDIKDVTISTSSIQRTRSKMRATLNEDIIKTFKVETPIIIHFDGKVMNNISPEKCERLAVVVSGKNVEKLLGIPNLDEGTGIKIAKKVLALIKEWNVEKSWIAGLCFDTTASNTGIHRGTCTVIEQQLQKRLLFLACRHHIFEIVINAVFDSFFTSRGPEIDIFVRFKKHWPFIDQKDYISLEGVTDKEKKWISDKRQDMVIFLRKKLEETHERQDYKEFIELALISLGEIPSTRIKFTAPGAYHRARWMSKGIYCLKIYLFRNQFRLEGKEMESIRRINIFCVSVYIKSWFTAAEAANSPINDLWMLSKLEDYQDIDRQVANVSLNKFKNHLWYLSEDLVSLAFFSDNNSEKSAMVEALKKKEKSKDLRRIETKAIKSFKCLSLSNFVTCRSLNLFRSLQIDESFLTMSPETWSDHPSYIYGKGIVSHLRVVNDCAERMIKLATDFNECITTHED